MSDARENVRGGKVPVARAHVLRFEVAQGPRPCLPILALTGDPGCFRNGRGA